MDNIIMEASCGWKAYLFDKGWVIIKDKNNKIISIHNEAFSIEEVIKKYKNDGWKIKEEKCLSVQIAE